MQNFTESLKNHFQELYTRKHVAGQLLQQNLTPHQRAEVSNGIEIIEMQIKEGLAFLG